MIIGSQAILGQFPAAPASLRMSVEADVYPKNHPERADLIDGSVGEASPFHDTYGYYARGVGETTAVLPRGWRDRLVPIHNANTRGATGWCLEVHDLVIAKTVAGREKDLEFLLEVAPQDGERVGPPRPARRHRAGRCPPSARGRTDRPRGARCRWLTVGRVPRRGMRAIPRPSCVSGALSGDVPRVGCWWPWPVPPGSSPGQSPTRPALRASAR